MLNAESLVPSSAEEVAPAGGEEELEGVMQQKNTKAEKQFRLFVSGEPAGMPYAQQRR